MGIGITRRLVACSVVVVMAGSGCFGSRDLRGVQHEPTPVASPREAKQPWVLIRNPRFGDVRGEPEYIWVEENRIPVTLSTLLFGQASVIARPEVVAKYGYPPSGGTLSRLHGDPSPVPKPGAAAPTPPREITPDMRLAAPPVPAGSSVRGYVVFVRKTRILVDLTDKDGLRPGSILSIRQPVPVVHPVTGQLLGAYEEEVATARVLEIHDMFSVAEIEGISPGVEIKLKDRALPR